LLIQPPLLPDGLLPSAALTAGAAVTLGPRALLAATSEPPCPHDSTRAPDALRLPAPQLLQRHPGATLDGTIALAALAPEWTALVDRLAAHLRPPGADGAHADTMGGSGVIAVDGDYTVRAGAVLRGVILVSGTLSIEADAVVHGVVLAAGPVELQGTIRFSPCAAAEVIRAAGLLRPRPYPLRPSVPAF
jgi:hypothetical protein